MAKVRFTPGGFEISGRVGNVVYRNCGGRTIATRRPAPSWKEPTEAKLAHQKRFQAAVAFGREMMSEPRLRSIYDEVARKTGKPVFAMTIRDFFNPPTVHEIDLFAYRGEPGDVIRIAASDDTQVVGVDVVLRDRDGVVIEEGSAEMSTAMQWVYTTTERVPIRTTVRIAATATDRPGGTHTLEAETIVWRD